MLHCCCLLTLVVVGCLPKVVVPPNHPKLGHLSMETDGFSDPPWQHPGFMAKCRWATMVSTRSHLRPVQGQQVVKSWMPKTWAWPQNPWKLVVFCMETHGFLMENPGNPGNHGFWEFLFCCSNIKAWSLWLFTLNQVWFRTCFSPSTRKLSLQVCERISQNILETGWSHVSTLWCNRPREPSFWLKLLQNIAGPVDSYFRN